MRLPFIRRPDLAALLVLALSLFAVPALAQDAPRTLTVTGEGRVSAAPDMATVRLGVVASAPDAARAIAQNNDRMAAVLDRLSTLGIADRDVQTSDFAVNPRWRRGPSGEGEQDGFEARNMVSVRVRDIARLGEVLDAVAGDGANLFQGLTWGFAAPEALEDAAREAAVVEARRKAALYAAAAGVTLGPLLSLTEGGGFAPIPQMSARMATMEDAVPVAGGSLDVAMSVTLVYGLE